MVKSKKMVTNLVISTIAFALIALVAMSPVVFLQPTNEVVDLTKPTTTGDNTGGGGGDGGDGDDGEHSDAPEWSYSNQESWSREYPDCMGVKLRQSPIDINTDDLVLKPDYELDFIDYNQFVEFQLKNTHHSISAIPIPSQSIPSIKLSWLPTDNEFELQEIHFHWGDGTNKGSEHEINDQKAAAEMHMVHYRRGLKKEDIGSRENSVLVIGVLIESDNIEHAKLEGLVENASQVNGTDSECISKNPEFLINLLPDHHQSFYTYEGSLTTPPCYEVVTWIVMSEPVYMSNERLIELSNIEANTPKGGRRKISSNYRDVQPLLGRPVYASFNTSESITIQIGNSSKIFDDAFDGYMHGVRGLGKSARDALSYPLGYLDAGKQKILQTIGFYRLVDGLNQLYYGTGPSSSTTTTSGGSETATQRR